MSLRELLAQTKMSNLLDIFAKSEPYKVEKLVAKAIFVFILQVLQFRRIQY